MLYHWLIWNKIQKLALIQTKAIFMKILLPFLLLSTFASAQLATGHWKVHSQSKNAIDITHNDKSVFVAFESTLLEYDTEYKEASTWDAASGLSDIKITTLGKHDGTNSVFVGYENGNIDQIQNGRAINIPGIKLASILGSKQLYSMKQHGAYVYVATGFGIVLIDPARNEIKDTYYPGSSTEPIIEITFKGDSIYALTQTRLYKANKNHPALADASFWEVDTRLPILTTPNFFYNDIEEWNNRLYFQKNTTAWSGDTVFVINGNNLEVVNHQNGFGHFTSLQVVDNKLVVNGRGSMQVLDENYIPIFELNTFVDNNQAFTNAIIRFQDYYWYADQENGAARGNFDGTFYKLEITGPATAKHFKMDWKKNKLAIVPGFRESTYFNYTPPSLVTLEKEKWTIINRNTESKWNNNKVWDLSSININPTNTDIVAVASHSPTPLSIVNTKENYVIDTFGIHNSTITTSLTGEPYVSGIQYDELGNLWVINGLTTNPLKIYTKDQTWHSFSLGTTAANKRTEAILLDYNNILWVSVNGQGIVAYDPGSSITSNTDDKIAVINTGQYTGKLPSNNVTALAMDFDGELWIGTDDGFAILYNTTNVFNGSPGTYNVQQPIIADEGNGAIVLGNVHITDIEVDGGNRKWMATSFSGMILLSENGTEVIQHFTTDNSPLISNNILDLQIDHKTGEIYIITDKGMMSYRGDATYEDESYSDVQVFPNPCRPDHDGVITIQGIRYDSDVKFTDVAGNLVYKTNSNGGTATWNGRDLDGNRVASGVYLIWTASNIHKGRYVGKVVVIN